MITMGDELNDNLKIVREHGYSTTVTSEYMNGWDRPSENEDWSHHNMYLTALRRIIKLEDDVVMLQKGICGTNAELSNAWATAERAEEHIEEIDGYLSYERSQVAKLKKELKECYDLHEVALEMVENE